MPDAIETFCSLFKRCWMCGTTEKTAMFGRLEVHHIVRGVHRKKALYERPALIRTCCRCHEKHLDGMPVAMQLALKRLCDFWGYDRVRVNQLRNRAPEAITEEDVDRAHEELLKKAGFVHAHLQERVRRTGGQGPAAGGPG